MIQVYNKISLLLIFFIIFSITCFGQSICTTTTCITVSSSEDDAEQFEDGYSYIVSRDLELVFDDDYPDTGFRGNQQVGIRFNSVDVPQGATITNAYIQFTADPIVTSTELANGGNNVDPCNLTIFGEAVDNATAFVEQLNNISVRPKTTANVAWSPPLWPTPGARTADQKTMDISTVIQELVNRPGYSIYNSMAIIITGTGRRTAAAYDGTSSQAPQLCIEYEYLCEADYVYDNGWQGGIDPNGIATNVEDILIKSGDATITNNTNINTVVVNPGATLSVNPLKNLSANSIILESESNKYSSLNPSSTSSITGTAIYNRYVNQVGSGASGGNDLISSPFTSGTMETFGSFADANPNLAASSSLRAFAPFNNITGVYVNYDVIANALTLLEKGLGYRVATDTDANNGGPLKFTGEVNIGAVNTTISIGGVSKWNLAGNPYTSYLDAQAFLNANGQSGGDVLDSNFNAIYGYNAGTDGSSGGSIWTIVNSIQNVGKNIAPGQGFFVASNGTGGSNNLTFTPAMRTLSGTDDFILGRQAQDASISHLKLTINSSTSYSSTDFYFNDSCSLGLDSGYDAGSFDASNSQFSIYSHLVSENNGIDMAIQALANSDMNDVVIPMGINALQGEELIVSIRESDLPSTTNVYLEDNVANKLTLLNTSGYIFTPLENLNGVGRFFLHFSSLTLSLNDENLSGLQIFTSANPKLLYVNGKFSDSSILDLYDIQGRLVLSKKLDVNSNSNVIGIESMSSGVYIVKLKISGLTRTQKVIIR